MRGSRRLRELALLSWTREAKERHESKVDDELFERIVADLPSEFSARQMLELYSESISGKRYGPRAVSCADWEIASELVCRGEISWDNWIMLDGMMPIGYDYSVKDSFRRLIADKRAKRMAKGMYSID